MPVDLIHEAWIFTTTALPNVIVKAPVGRLALSKDGLVFLRVGVDVILELEKFLLVNCEQRELLTSLRISQILLCQLDWIEVDSTDSLGEMIQW